MSSATYNKSTAAKSPKPWWAPTTTLLWVGLITVLIWVYADLEFTSTEKLTVTLQLHTGDSPDLVLQSKPETRVTFELRGSRRELDQFVAQHDGTVVRFDVSKVLDTGLNQRLRSAEILNTVLEVEKKGLSIHSATPDSVVGIDLDRRVLRKNVPVRFLYSGADLEGVIPETTMDVWAVQSDWDRIDETLKTTGATGELRTVTKDLKAVERGKPVDAIAEIIPSIAGVPVQPVQKTVTVQIKIRDVTSRKSIRVAVHVTTPYTWLHDDTWLNYQLERKSEGEWVQDVEVTGPREDLDKLQTQKVNAYIILEDNDKPKVGQPESTFRRRQVQFRFPPDLRVKLVGEYYVEFKLVPRKAGTPPTAP